MTANEKAKQLISKYSPKLPFYTEKDNLNKSKECALICVDEILDFQINTMKWATDYNGNIHYWQEVKEEIEKL